MGAENLCENSNDKSTAQKFSILHRKIANIPKVWSLQKGYFIMTMTIIIIFKLHKYYNLNENWIFPVLSLFGLLIKCCKISTASFITIINICIISFSNSKCPHVYVTGNGRRKNNWINGRVLFIRKRESMI